MNTEELLTQFLEVTRSFMNLEDPDALLQGVLLAMRRMTNADAGSIYVVTRQDGRSIIRFKAAQNDSVELHLDEFEMNVDDRSIVGRAVQRRTAINVPDLYDPAGDWYSKRNRRVDRESTICHGQDW